MAATSAGCRRARWQRMSTWRARATSDPFPVPSAPKPSPSGATLSPTKSVTRSWSSASIPAKPVERYGIFFVFILDQKVLYLHLVKKYYIYTGLKSFIFSMGQKDQCVHRFEKYSFFNGPKSPIFAMGRKVPELNWVEKYQNWIWSKSTIFLSMRKVLYPISMGSKRTIFAFGWNAPYLFVPKYLF